MQSPKKTLIFAALILSTLPLAADYTINSADTVTTTSQWPETATILDMINGIKVATAAEFTTALDALIQKKAHNAAEFSNHELQCLKQGNNPAHGLITGIVGDFPSVQQVAKKFGGNAQNSFVRLLIQ